MSLSSGLRTSLVLAGLCLAAPPSCRRDPPLPEAGQGHPSRPPGPIGPGPTLPGPGTPPPTAPPLPLPTPSGPSVANAPPARPRQGSHVLRSLVRESARAELWHHGLFINLGTPNQHKYVRGGWFNNWGIYHPEGNRWYVDARNKSWLVFHDWKGGIREIRVMARTDQAGQKMTLLLNGRTLGSQPLAEAWQELHYTVGPPTAPGRQLLFFTFSRNNPDSAPAQVEWIWARTRLGPTVTPKKTLVASFGEPRRALCADPPRTLSYYLVMPDQSSLAFDYAADQEMGFEVTAHVDGEPPRTLFAKRTGTGRWETGTADLAALGGKAVRLDFTTDGAAGRAAWGEPDIIRRGPPPQVPPVPPSKQARHVLHIVVDAARQDVYSAYNPKSRVKTPVLSAIAEGSTLFENAYVNANWTLPSVASFLSGRYFQSFMQNSQIIQVPRQVPFLPEHLQKHGFITAAFIANAFISEPYGMKRGWSFYRNYPREERKDTAEAIVPDVIDWLREHQKSKQRLYLYVHTMEPHDPYYLHEGLSEYYYGKPYNERFKQKFTNEELKLITEKKMTLTPGERAWIRALYDGEVDFHDRQLAALWAALKQFGLQDSTLFIYSADHGEELWDHGGLDHGHTMYEELMRCPLIIHYPPLFPPGRRVAPIVEAVDLVPTQLEALGLPPMDGTHGESLRLALYDIPSPISRYAYMEGHERAARAGRYKLIQTMASQQLFDLAADPGETRDLKASHPIALRTLEVHLGESLANPNKRQRLTGMEAPNYTVFPKEQVRMDENLKRQLQALGYLE